MPRRKHHTRRSCATVCAMPNLSDTYGVYNIFNGVYHVFNHRLPGKWQTNQKSVCFWEGNVMRE